MPLTVVTLLDEMPDFIRAFNVRNNDASGTGVECRRQADLVVFWHTNNNHGLSLRVMLSSMDSADLIRIRFLLGSQLLIRKNSLVQGQSVKHAMLNVNPDEVGLRRRHDLSYMSA